MEMCDEVVLVFPITYPTVSSRVYKPLSTCSQYLLFLIFAIKEILMAKDCCLAVFSCLVNFFFILSPLQS